ncbi:Isochorismatase-like protein [Mycena sp. CBHHK59/15]|nr:Isochorismatase-like protein [Mycena sp. CBHHK59/15]
MRRPTLDQTTHSRFASCSLQHHELQDALLIVDLQEDFLPPNGSLAVSGGRDIVPVINSLLASPLFDVKVATKDWHPADHISFAANHPNRTIGRSNSYETRLWPVHCVQGTPGARLVPELDVDKVDKIIEKGQDKRVEMYSAFADPFENPRVAQSELQGYLKEQSVGKVYVVGLAMDYCVKATAEDAAKEGFTTFIIEDATKAQAEMQGRGIKFVGAKTFQFKFSVVVSASKDLYL